MQDILSVSELTHAIKQQLESRFHAVAVQGEVTNLKEQSSGHIYFSLKDKEAQVSAVLFRGNARTLTQPLKTGDQVILRGELSLYAPRGTYQIIVRTVESVGVGQLLLQFHQLKAKLEQKGYFDPARKKPLPKYPKRIGVVTSPTGAVIQDIIHVLQRRFAGVSILLNPVKVQGEGAAQEIAKAIDQFNQYHLADVVIVGRGGGSLEDLWAFNEECVADSIFRSQIPILSAVGHETDFCIADFVSDLRAPTPSAAAEIVIGEKIHQLAFLQRARQQIALHTRKTWEEQTQKTLDLQDDIDNAWQQFFLRLHLKLQGLQKQTAASNPLTQTKTLQTRLHSLQTAMQGAIRQSLHAKRALLPLAIKKDLLNRQLLRILAEQEQRLKQLAAHLHTMNPKNVLSRGYAILFHEKKDSVILSSKSLSNGMRICALLHDGEIEAMVDNVSPHDR